MPFSKPSWRIRRRFLAVPLDKEEPRILLRNCLKNPEGARNLASQDTEAALCGPFWPQHTEQIDAPSVVRTPFQTVSGRSSQKNPLGAGVNTLRSSN